MMTITNLHEYLIDLLGDIPLTYNVMKQNQQLPVVCYNIIDRSNDLNCLNGTFVDNVTIQLNIYSKTIKTAYSIFEEIESRFTNSSDFWRRVCFRETNVDNMCLIICQYQTQEKIFI